jgi:hypothetical protein
MDQSADSLSLSLSLFLFLTLGLFNFCFRRRRPLLLPSPTEAAVKADFSLSPSRDIHSHRGVLLSCSCHHCTFNLCPCMTAITPPPTTHSRQMEIISFLSAAAALFLHLAAAACPLQ